MEQKVKEIKSLLESDDLKPRERKELKEKTLPRIALLSSPSKRVQNGYFFLPTSFVNLRKNLDKNNLSLFRQLFAQYLQEIEVNPKYSTRNKTYSHGCRSINSEKGLIPSKPLRTVALDFLKEKEDLDEIKDKIKNIGKVRDLFEILKAKYLLENARKGSYVEFSENELKEKVSDILDFLSDDSLDKLFEKAELSDFESVFPEGIYCIAVAHSFNSSSCTKKEVFIIREEVANELYNLVSEFEPVENMKNSFTKFKEEQGRLYSKLNLLKLLKQKFSNNEPIYESDLDDIYKEAIEDLKNEGTIRTISNRIIVEPNQKQDIDKKIKSLEKEEEKALKDWLETDFGEVEQTTDRSTGKKVYQLKPDTPFSNVQALKDVLQKCHGEIKWLDKHFSRRGIEFLSDMSDHLKENCSKVRILTGPDNVNHRMRKDVNRFKEEMENKGVEISLRVLPKSEPPLKDIHDRWILSNSHTWNVPPLNSIFQNQEAEIVKTDSEINFEEKWESGKDILKEWNEVQKIL